MRQGIKICILSIQFGIIASGCMVKQKGFLEAEDYVRYVERASQGMSGTVKSGEWSYHFQYKPSAYIALKELEGSAKADSTIIANRQSSLEHTVWFNVAISVGNRTTDPLKYQVKDLTEYNTRLNYFLTQAPENFHLLYADSGEMRQVGYYFENNYSIKPEVVAIVGFSIPDAVPKERMTIEYEDKLFGSGILKFQISSQALAQLPKLTIKQS